MKKTITLSLLGLVLGSTLLLSPAYAEVSQATMIDVLTRLEQLEKKTRELHGDNEMLRHELDKLKKIQKEGFLNVDERVEALATKIQSASKAATPAETVTTTPEKEKTEAEKNNVDAKDSTASKIDTVISEAATGETKATSTDDKETTEVAKKSAKKAPTKYEKETYQAAFEKMKKSPTAGTLAFQEYIKMQPKSPLTPNAQYWIGEIKYSHNNYKGAVQEFIKVLQKYKYSDKAPDAAIKLGYSFYALKNWAYARRTFDDVLKYFPENANAVNLAKKRLAKMDAAGH